MVIKSAIENIIREKDIQKIYLNVRQDNMRAIRCYERLGFETIYEGEKKLVQGKSNLRE
jgi:ribosomal protein S18 acetylase RimI-like enzyme